MHMKLTINGEHRDLPASLTVRGMLEHLGFAEKPVVVELNLSALFPREFSTTPLQDGDRIEIVQITAGG